MAIRRIRFTDLLFGGTLAAPAAVGDTQQDDAPQAHGQHGQPAHLESILRTLNHLNRRLEHALAGLRDRAGADTELRAIAADLHEAVRRDRDIAVACALLNQIAGTYGVRHCLETAIVALVVAQAMGKTDAELLVIAAAALTMNAGMVPLADAFHGREGALSSDERAQVRRHPRDSVDLLRWAGVDDEEWLSYVLLHHENEDGSGYPDGRAGAEIAENARLIGAADRYCAMVSARNYRRSLLPPLALERMATEATPAVMRVFHKALGPWPPGTLVRLHSGDTGVVCGRAGDGAALEVCTLRGADGAMLAQPVHRFTSEAGCAIVAALHEDEARLRFTMQQVWGALAAL